MRRLATSWSESRPYRPESLEIVGPETSVQARHRGDPRERFRSPMRDSIRQDVSVGLIDPALRLKTQRTVTVSVKDCAGPLERSLRGVPVHIRNLGPQLSAQVVHRLWTSGCAGAARCCATQLRRCDHVRRRRQSGELASAPCPCMPIPRAAPASPTSEPATVQVRINSAKEAIPLRRFRGWSERTAFAERPARFPLDHPTICGGWARRSCALRSGAAPPRILVGRDTRESGDGSKPNWLMAPAAGARVTTPASMPTPAVAYCTRSPATTPGSSFSASHNPFEDNGHQGVLGRGEKFTEDVERAVEAIVADVSWNAAAARRTGVAVIGRTSTRTAIIFAPCLPGVASLGPELAIDCANGATTPWRRGLFAEPRLRYGP